MSNKWPPYARPTTPEEEAAARHLERVYAALDRLRADAVLLLSALQQIEHSTTDEHAAKRARSALDSYAAAREEADNRKKETDP